MREVYSRRFLALNTPTADDIARYRRTPRLTYAELTDPEGRSPGGMVDRATPAPPTLCGRGLPCMRKSERQSMAQEKGCGGGGRARGHGSRLRRTDQYIVPTIASTLGVHPRSA